jgi:hypothetical protein
MQSFLAVAIALPLAGFAQTVPRKVPARLHQYLTSAVRLSQAEHTNLLNGAPVTKLLDADPALEVAVFGAVWINAPRQRYVDLLQDIENFERGRGFRVTKRISSPPQLGDFATGCSASLYCSSSSYRHERSRLQEWRERRMDCG